MKTTDYKPKLLVIRPKRDTCKAFYSKFKKFEVNYLDIGPVNNLSLIFIPKLAEKIKNTDCVCLSDNYYSYNLQAAILAKIYKKPIVTILWCTIPNHISTWLFPYSLFSKVVVGLTNLFILRNHLSLSFAKSLGIDDSKIKVVYKGVDLKHFYPENIKARNKKTTNILYVGLYDKSKGLKELLDAFERLISNGINAKLHLAGQGKMQKYIEERSKTLPIVNHGYVNYDKLASIYRNADVFCSPSKEIRLMGIKTWEEYFSYTLMEAQASGLPIVTTTSGGIVEEVDKRNVFVKMGDSYSLYNGLLKLINNSNLRQQLSVTNRKRAQEIFNADIQAQKTEIEILEKMKCF